MCVFLPEESRPKVEESGSTCTMNIKFRVRHEMAPFSRLLVYYVRPDGEGVADTMMFDVTPQFVNRVGIIAHYQQLLTTNYFTIVRLYYLSFIP